MLIVRRLTLRQLVSLDVGGPEGRVDCRVGAITREQATLVPVGRLAEYTQAKLETECPCYLVFDDGGIPVGLRGAARAAGSGSQMFFSVVDGVQLTQRRSAARVPIRAPTTLTPVAAAGRSIDPVETVTVNLSLGGALIEVRPGMDDGPDWRFEVRPTEVPQGIAGLASLVRRTRTSVGVAFSEISESDRLRLATVLLSWRDPAR